MSVVTMPVFTDYEDVTIEDLQEQELFFDFAQKMWACYATSTNSNPSPQMVTTIYLPQSESRTTDPEITFREYGEGPNTVILVDFGEPTTDFPKEQQTVVNYLRDNGRPILADRLLTILEDAMENPDETTIDIFSLRDVARLLVEYDNFADPAIGTDRLGIIHAQWRIVGNGILVMSFLGHDEILLIAQADAHPDGKALDITKRGPKQEILQEFGDLVPCR